jgi:aspartate/methionine/tyrosine aminotransferase
VTAAWTSTQLEYDALDSTINLSDGHARMPLNTELRDVIVRSIDAFDAAFTQPQSDIEDRFFRAYATLAGQTFARRPLLAYSVSSLVSVLATYFRQHGMTVAIAEPSFDSIRDQLTSGGVQVTLFPEQTVSEFGDAMIPGCGPDVVWLTSPANPTGRTLDEQTYDHIARACARARKILIVDHCFRFFARSIQPFDQHALLDATPGLDYVVLEETGKTVPFLDLKVGMLCASQALSRPLDALNKEVLLNVSPYVLVLLTEALQHLIAGGLQDWLLPMIDRNRDSLQAALSPYADHLRLASHAPDTPLLWYRTSTEDGGERLAQVARSLGVHVLPGNTFYASRRSFGSAYIRIALSRDPAVVDQGARIIACATRRVFGAA